MKQGFPLAGALAFFISAGLSFYVGSTMSIVAGFFFTFAAIMALREWVKRKRKSIEK